MELMQVYKRLLAQTREAGKPTLPLFTSMVMKSLSLKTIIDSRGILCTNAVWRDIEIFDGDKDKPIVITPIIACGQHDNWGILIDIKRCRLNEDGTYEWLRLEDKLKIRKLFFLDDFINALRQAQEYLEEMHAGKA